MFVISLHTAALLVPSTHKSRTFGKMKKTLASFRFQMSLKQLVKVTKPAWRMQQVCLHFPAVSRGSRRFQFLNPGTREIHHSTTAADIKGSTPDEESRSVRISSSLTLRRAVNNRDLNTCRNNPLVLLFPWLEAPQKAVDKYLELYNDKGWDVLLVRSSAKHFLWPSNAKQVVQELLEYVSSKEVLQERTDFIVHSMSIGAFIYTVTFIELQEHAKKYQEFTRKLQGQIFDSIVIGGSQQMGKGLADSASKGLLGRLSIRALFAVYLLATKKWTADYYDYTVQRFIEKPVPIPTLMFYSLDDPNCSSYAILNVIGNWRACYPQMRVKYKSWRKSVHAAHLLMHREEYVSELDNFLASIDMTNGSTQSKL